jgi:hypothetical protein
MERPRVHLAPLREARALLEQLPSGPFGEPVWDIFAVFLFVAVVATLLEAIEDVTDGNRTGSVALLDGH